MSQVSQPLATASGACLERPSGTWALAVTAVVAQEAARRSNGRPPSKRTSRHSAVSVLPDDRGLVGGWQQVAGRPLICCCCGFLADLRAWKIQRTPCSFPSRIPSRGWASIGQLPRPPSELPGPAASPQHFPKVLTLTRSLEAPRQRAVVVGLSSERQGRPTRSRRSVFRRWCGGIALEPFALSSASIRC